MRKFVLMAALAALVASFALPANAAGTTWNGVVSTGCTTRLDDFPNSASTQNSDDCDNDTNGANVNGGAIDFGVGVINTQAGQWRGNGVGATRVTFEYNENCGGVPNGVFPPFGTAKGNFLVTGTLGTNSSATLLAGFNWTRTGLVATITFGPTDARSTDAATPGGSKAIAGGLFGIDTNGNFANVEVPAPANTTAAAVGLLQPRGGAGSNGLPVNNCPDNDGSGQWEVVTAYAVGPLSG